MNLDAIAGTARRQGLAVVGAFHPSPDDKAPENIATLCLLGPDDAAMWEHFKASPEAKDNAPDPLDRWSRRVIDAMADQLGARALYPFGGPPYQAFQHWAARGEGALPSPVGMQVSPRRGLWASYRGALGFARRVPLPALPQDYPCEPCPSPCLTACPVDAFAGGSYDVPRCVAYITTPAGRACREGGCLVRHACPAGKALALPDAQRRFHMDMFIRARLASD